MPKQSHVPAHGHVDDGGLPTNWTKSGTLRKVGPGTADKVRAERPLTRSETDALIREVQHSLCVDHVAVEGLRKPVCVLRGQDRDAVVADAVELAGGRTLAGDGRRGS